MMDTSAFWCAILVATVALSTGAQTKDSIPEKNGGFEHVVGLGYYHVVETLYNWTEAYDHCQSLGGHLAVANSDKEADTLATLAQRYPSDSTYTFVGVSDLNKRGEFITVEGDLIGRSGFNKWTDKQPTYDTRCAGISKSGEGLTHESCADFSQSICEMPVWRKEYTYVEGIGYYKAYPGGWAWPQAMSACEKDGAHLAIINSEEEYAAIQHIFNDQLIDIPTVEFDDFVWLGGHSQFKYMNFVTIFGEPLSETGYNIWADGHPADSPSYLGINRNGALASRYAYIAYPYAYGAICEHALH